MSLKAVAVNHALLRRIMKIRSSRWRQNSSAVVAATSRLLATSTWGSNGWQMGSSHTKAT